MPRLPVTYDTLNYTNVIQHSEQNFEKTVTYDKLGQFPVMLKSVYTITLFCISLHELAWIEFGPVESFAIHVATLDPVG